jgi:myo-inositol-1(or 4)-monophosphatase
MQASIELTAMIEAAQSAANALLAWSRRLSELAVHAKTGPADLVSEADKESEAIIRAALGRVRPDYAILGEEGGRQAGDDENLWVIDPLDGTTNFLYGAPLWGVNIALARGGKVEAGVICLPALGEMYVAERGGGATLNGKPIRVSQRAALDQALLGCGIPFAGKPEHSLFAREMALLTSNVAGIRRTGACSVDMAWVASGRWDAYWERSLCAWDMAPGLILVEEAGGTATDSDGGPYQLESGNVCLSNGRLHAALIANLRAARAAETAGLPIGMTGSEPRA